MLNQDDPIEAQATAAANELLRCYQCLSDDSIFHADVLYDASKRFAASYVALNTVADDPKLWRVKPKLHLFLELCAEGSRPSRAWTYRDEDFGGSMAPISAKLFECGPYAI